MSFFQKYSDTLTLSFFIQKYNLDLDLVKINEYINGGKSKL